MYLQEYVGTYSDVNFHRRLFIYAHVRYPMLVTFFSPQNFKDIYQKAIQCLSYNLCISFLGLL